MKDYIIIFTRKNTAKILIFLGIIILSYLIPKTISEYNKISYFFEIKKRECLIIDKDVRQYNSTQNTRSFGLKYKNIFKCKYKGHIFEMTVSDDYYYSNKIGDNIYLNLSLADIYCYIPNNDNLPFFIYFSINSIIIILILVYFLPSYNI